MGPGTRMVFRPPSPVKRRLPSTKLPQADGDRRFTGEGPIPPTKLPHVDEQSLYGVSGAAVEEQRSPACSQGCARGNMALSRTASSSRQPATCQVYSTPAAKKAARTSTVPTTAQARTT